MEEQEARLLAIQEKWKKEYERTLPEKWALLDSLLKKMQIEIDEETLKAFRIEIHKMAGTAGTVGYMDVSVMCKEFDSDLCGKLKELPNKAWIPAFQEKLGEIKKAFLDSTKD